MKCRNSLKILIILIYLFSLFNPANFWGATMNNDNVYQFKFTSLGEDKDLSLNQFRGKVILIVNTASKCGFTGQYDDLENLYQKYRNQGLVIIGVPSNDFGGQEPGSAGEIKNFCRLNYGVSFPLTEKEIVSGKNAHPFYLWASKKLGFASTPKWNFHKYLIDRNGELVDFFLPTTNPLNPNVVNKIESSLNEKELNVLGEKLALHCTDPLTGFYRDGYCKTGDADQGSHVIAAIVTREFLEFTKSRGNDLSTPNSNFPGLKPGDKWCLCALRWKESYDAGLAPPVVLEATNKKALNYIPLDVLKKFQK